MELRADVVVIGTGAGGAPAAARLAEAGLEVVVLEAGPRLETGDFDGDAASLLPRLMTTRLAADSGMNVYGGACVGGSTVVNDALCWRPPPDVLDSWQREHGLGDLNPASLERHVERVWRDLHVSPTDRAHLNRNAYRLELGAARLGWDREAMPRNVRGCANLGLCNLGCPTGAKQSTLLTFIPQAERAGAQVLARTRAERVRIEAGRVQAVEAVRMTEDGSGAEEAVRIVTPRVCVAAGVLETPALLLRSGLTGRAGRGLQFHTSAYVTARFEEPVYAYYGPTMSFAVSEFADVNGHTGPGFMIENVTVSEATAASALPGVGPELERVMAALPHLARAVLVLRDDTRGTLELSDGEAARLSYSPTQNDLNRLRQGMLAAARAFFAADALEVFLPVHGLPPLRNPAELEALDLAFDPRDLATIYAVHLFGGACMAGDAARGTCDVEGRVFGVRGLFVTDASVLPGNTGVNPQVTIMANALRIAEGIAAGAGAGTNA